MHGYFTISTRAYAEGGAEGVTGNPPFKLIALYSAVHVQA